MLHTPFKCKFCNKSMDTDRLYCDTHCKDAYHNKRKKEERRLAKRDRRIIETIKEALRYDNLH